MKFPDKVYEFLKWFCLICLPACSTCLFAIGSIFGWTFTEQVTGVIAAVTTLIGALIGISTANYNKSKGGE
ncbi:MAG: hypothetical protein IJP45_09165 [Paludibacteraceae bacterium]|nr:hypothetical protein [Paludibacteraceae bacterium]